MLTHFCSRSRPHGGMVPPSISGTTAQDRLSTILWENQLRAFVTFSGGDPAVCFTETTVQGFQFYLGRRLYEPWGLIFTRQSIYSAGGSPVWHARPEQFTELCQRNMSATTQLRSWAVRLGENSDFLEEREWRIVRAPTPNTTPAISLNELELFGLIVGDPMWVPIRTGWMQSVTGQLTWGNWFPPVIRGLQRWWWNPQAQHLQAIGPFLT